MFRTKWLLRILFLLVILILQGCQSWSGCEEFTIEDVAYLLDHKSPNYRHLEGFSSSGSFLFEAGDLESLSNLNHFNVQNGQDKVLFGLRGCQIAGDYNGSFVTSVELSEVAPDHVSYLDVLGVWKRSTGEIAVFQGSTVPNWQYMCMQAEKGGHNANMLPTGMYIYEVGMHKSIEGAFRQNAEVVVLRSNDDLIYETTDYWEIWTPMDNIHPGSCPGKPFSSAGCQTIEGAYGQVCPDYPNAEPEQHVGLWANFRDYAGLDPNNNRDKWGESFVYVLLTCRDAQLVSTLEDLSELTRLRFGSSGDSVEALQNALQSLGYSSVPISGQMGPETTLAYIQWQQNQYNGAADGIVTPEQANVLGFSLDE